jgi:hypothetical protein
MSLFSAKPRPQPVDRRRSLQSIPALNPGIQLEPQEDDRLMVTIPVSLRKGLLSRFLPRHFDRQVRLDSLGAFVLGQIDGEHTVADIVEAFVRRFRVNRREAELSTAQFLKSLAQRNIISIGVR